MAEKRKRGTGSLFQRNDGRWVFQLQHDGVRRYGTGKTPQEAEASARYGKPRPMMPRMPDPPAKLHPILWKRDRSEDQAIARERRVFATLTMRMLIQAAQRYGWTEDYFARVTVAQLSANRIRARVAGPCAYCRTWLANSVDHVVPTVRGGVDEPSNRVSACFSCNSVKQARLGTEWRRSA